VTSLAAAPSFAALAPLLLAGAAASASLIRFGLRSGSVATQ